MNMNPASIALFLRGYRGRLQAQVQATHDPSDAADTRELISSVSDQITACEQAAAVISQLEVLEAKARAAFRAGDTAGIEAVHEELERILFPTASRDTALAAVAMPGMARGEWREVTERKLSPVPTGEVPCTCPACKRSAGARAAVGRQFPGM